VNTVATAHSDPVLISGSFAAAWLARIRAVRGYDATARVLGVGWFFALALAVAAKAVTHARMSIVDFNPAAAPALFSSVCLCLFYLALCWGLLLRPAPIARSDGVLPSIIAFAGTYLPWTVVLFAPGEPSTTEHFMSAALFLGGTMSMVVVIVYLGRSFSIVPQATTLVVAGPYAVVRNPLYLAEEVALLGTLLQCYSPVTFGLFLAHGVLQVRRIIYEETLLRRTFGNYDRYAASTARLIPYIW
jgi:protein-S-isoprenylcysteine O-methyltransferase Ste14